MNRILTPFLHISTLPHLHTYTPLQAASEARGFVDGDLVEAFLDLPRWEVWTCPCENCGPGQVRSVDLSRWEVWSIHIIIPVRLDLAPAWVVAIHPDSPPLLLPGRERQEAVVAAMPAGSCFVPAARVSVEEVVKRVEELQQGLH